MADALDSTTAPIGRLLSLSADAALFGMGAFVARAVDDATAAVLARVGRSAPARDARGRFAKSADDLLREIAEEIDRQEGVLKSEHTPMGLPKSGDTPELPPEPLLSAADRARVLHLRRQLEAAAEHGAALLATLGLPRLVGPDTIVVDPVAAGDALDLAIAALDALDADPDLEEGGDDEATGDDELSLGWREAVSQLDLGHGQDDGEPTLGAPERSPYTTTMSEPWHKPARGGQLARCFGTQTWSQAAWAAGTRQDGEGESEAGYDLPEGDDERDDDGLSHGEGDTADNEPTLGSPTGNGDQEHWAQGASTADEPEADPLDDITRTRSAAEWEAVYARRPSLHALAARARALRAGAAVPRDPDTVTPIGPGMMSWQGPAYTRGGYPIVGTVGT